jgi:hypothetical protein
MLNQLGMAHCTETISATIKQLGNKSNIQPKFSEVQGLFLSDQSINHILRDHLSRALSSYNPPEDHILTGYPSYTSKANIFSFFPLL